MLFKETVNPLLLKIAKEIFELKEFENFVLVGGTALSLQIGNRISTDIDLFSKNEFDSKLLIQTLEKKFELKVNNQFRNSLLTTVENIKVDIISHQYEWIVKPSKIEGLTISSLEVITAMKLEAISDNGTRLKDFVDIAFLSSKFSLEQMLSFFENKYPYANSMIAFKSLSWFDDINFDVEIIYLKKEIFWQQIKNRIFEMTQFPQKIFSPL